MRISAKIIADSLSPFGHRLTTFLLVMPRIILAEFNTHRMFSRNSASSRAIPFLKALVAVWKNPFIPSAWMKDHKGMQGKNYFTGTRSWLCRHLWLGARVAAIVFAWSLNKAGLSKQICNRILEPWMWHTVIVTASEWENFFALRAHEGAEIHMQELANQMLLAYNQSTPKQRKSGEWHIPFGDDLDVFSLNVNGITMNEAKVKIATARCARVSYTTVGDNSDKHDYAKDIALHDRLAASGHWSPFEHCAKVMSPGVYHSYHMGQFMMGKGDGTGERLWYNDEPGWCKNFRGFIQYRATFPNENKTDNRVRKEYAPN